MTVEQIKETVDQKMLMTRSLADWQPILSRECQVYRFENGSYLAKHFSQIQYTICDVTTATNILIDNLYALLRNKYFSPLTDEALERINQIVKTFTTNLTDVLLHVTFNPRIDEDGLLHIRNLPNGCVAFKNGVFDFRKNDWLFTYSRTRLKTGADLVEYPLDYVVRFYFNFNFTSLDINVNDFTLEEFEQALVEVDKDRRNMCFELVHNMSFDELHKFSLERFEHLCQIMGYMCCSSMVEQFSIIFGTGQNGKDSLFRGCFTHHIIPTPASLSLDDIIEAQFATGTLEGKCHNINLELSPKTYKDVARLKVITGGEEIDIEKKGVQSHTGVINCRQLFAGNVQDDIKFADTSNGFLRRVNIFNVYYVWDNQKNFMKRGDYFDTTFTLDELKYDIYNAVMFVYLGMFGLKSATNGFMTDFKFTHNEWSNYYTTTDADLVTDITSVTPKILLGYARASDKRMIDFDKALYGSNRKKLWRNEFEPSMFYLPTQDLYQKYVKQDSGMVEFSSVTQFLKSEYTAPYENDVLDIDMAYEVLTQSDEFYIRTTVLQDMLGYKGKSPREFNTSLKQAFGATSIERLTENQPYIRCRFVRGKLTIIK